MNMAMGTIRPQSSTTLSRTYPIPSRWSDKTAAIARSSRNRWDQSESESESESESGCMREKECVYESGCVCVWCVVCVFTRDDRSAGIQIHQRPLR